MSRCLTFSKLLQTIKLNHCKLLLVEKRKEKRKKHRKFLKMKIKASCLIHLRHLEYRKKFCVWKGGVYCKIITYNVGDSATLWWEGWVVVKSADMCYSLPPQLIWFCCT